MYFEKCYFVRLTFGLWECVYKMVALKLLFDAPEMQHEVFEIIHDEAVRKGLKFIVGLF